MSTTKNPSRSARPAAGQERKNARILVIDDDQEVRRTFEAILKDEGYEIDFAESGEEGIRKSRESFYNVTLVDIRLPDMLGTDVLSQLRENVPKTVKIMVTGFASLDNAVDSLNKGADYFIMKPFDPQDLLTAVRKGLRKQKDSLVLTQEKVAEFIESRASDLSSGSQETPK